MNWAMVCACGYKIMSFFGGKKRRPRADAVGDPVIWIPYFFLS